MKTLYKNLYVAGQITAQDIPTIAEAGIKTIINNRPDGEEIGQPNHNEINELAESHNIDYHYLPMHNGQPLPESIVSDFKAVLANTNEPVLAHCRSGMRSSFIWALGQIPDGSVTVDEAIEAAAGAGIPLSNFRSVLESL